MRVLIVGGYGTFGGRLAHLLANESRLTLLIAGRSLAKAQAFCQSHVFSAVIQAVVFDREADLERQITLLQPQIIVDATGPFQNYGTDPYKLVKACLNCRVNYLDLADGSDFVSGITQFDQQAKANNIFILSGVSSFPVLTAAVVRHLALKMKSIESIKAGIAPSPYAGVGLNVIKAITSYAGKEITVKRNGQIDKAYALTETIRYQISPPNYKPLPNILFSLVDVPDLKVLAELWPNVKNIWVGAGPVPAVLHRILIFLSRAVKYRLLPSLLPFARLFYYVINVLRWGEHRGGMFVLLEGKSLENKQVEYSWHLLAEGNDGPYIPSMAIEAIIRKILDDNMPETGARSAVNELELVDYLRLFKDKTIYTGEKLVSKD